jgi:hypothetical protein
LAQKAYDYIVARTRAAKPTHVVHDRVQLLPRLAHARAVGRVDDKDEALRVLEVVAPQAADLRAHGAGRGGGGWWGGGVGGEVAVGAWRCYCAHACTCTHTGRARKGRHDAEWLRSTSTHLGGCVGGGRLGAFFYFPGRLALARPRGLS